MAQNATTPSDDSDVTELAKAGQDKGGKDSDSLQTNRNGHMSERDQPPGGQKGRKPVYEVEALLPSPSTLRI